MAVGGCWRVTLRLAGRVGVAVADSCAGWFRTSWPLRTSQLPWKTPAISGEVPWSQRTRHRLPVGGWRCGWRVEWGSQWRTVASRRSRQFRTFFSHLPRPSTRPTLPWKAPQVSGDVLWSWPTRRRLAICRSWRVAPRLAGRSVMRGWGRHVARGEGHGVERVTMGTLVGFGGALHVHLVADRGVRRALEVVSVASGASALAAPCGRCGLSRV